MSPLDASVGDAYLKDVIRQYRMYKGYVDKALPRVPDADLHTAIDGNSNSIAVIMKHVSGNLRSRFRDFLTADGEKPDRNRDGEFEIDVPPDRDSVMADWERGWTVLFMALDALKADDLLRDVFIRGERHSVMQALDRQLIHHAYHVGQVVFLAKHLNSATWKTLTIPRRRR